MKALAHPEVYAQCRPLVVGDARRLERAGGIVGTRLQVRPVATPAEARYESRHRRLHRSRRSIPADLPVRQDLEPSPAMPPTATSNEPSRSSRAGDVDAICTAPINKEALHAGGHHFPGHTEVLADLTGTPEVSMMLWRPRLRVIHVTTHVGLLDAIERIDAGLVERTIRARP